jgi:hypothetical protein
VPLEKTTLINYRGSIKYETMGELIHNFKLQVPKMGIPTGIYKRLLLIMIESLENIMKHSEQPKEMSDDIMPGLSIVRKKDQYLIQSSNLLNSQQIPQLKKRIDYLNSLDQQGLKRIYKETITDGIFTKSGGAGLGLIEISKISGNPIRYEFLPVNQEYVCYIQHVTINA